VGKSIDEDPIKEHKRETKRILESPGNYINRRSPGNHVLGIVSFFHKHHCNNSYSNITIRTYKIYFNIYIIIVLLYYNNSFFMLLFIEKSHDNYNALWYDYFMDININLHDKSQIDN
jgi:hypothetical protein